MSEPPPTIITMPIYAEEVEVLRAAGSRDARDFANLRTGLRILQRALDALPGPPLQFGDNVLVDNGGTPAWSGRFVSLRPEGALGHRVMAVVVPLGFICVLDQDGWLNVVRESHVRRAP